LSVVVLCSYLRLVAALVVLRCVEIAVALIRVGATGISTS